MSDDGEVVTDTAVSDDPLPDAQAAHGEVSAVVEEALGALDPEDREVVLLRDVEGLSTKEAAETLQISVAALKSRLHRARATLREAVRGVVEQQAERVDPGCPQVIEAFSRKLEGDLSETDCETFQQHIASCPACARRCESIQAVLGACATLRTGPITTDVQSIIDRTVAAYRDSTKS